MGKKMPSQRTLEYLRNNYPHILVDKVERWIPGENLPGGGIRKDLFGIIDLIAIRDGRIVGIQCSGYTAIKKHVDKIEAAEATVAWLTAGGVLEVWGFKKTKLGKTFRYEPKIVPIVLPEGIFKLPAPAEKPKPVTELFA